MPRTYAQDFVNDAVKYVEEHPDITILEAAKNLGIPHSTLYGWVRGSRRRKMSLDSEPIKGNLTDEEKEIIRLKKELQDTKDALDILKKAISILGE
ncbi:MAG: transposase [Synergistes sp.]|nr:transposase [Synergistes sp.]